MFENTIKTLCVKLYSAVNLSEMCSSEILCGGSIKLDRALTKYCYNKVLPIKANLGNNLKLLSHILSVLINFFFAKTIFQKNSGVYSFHSLTAWLTALKQAP